jgi:hypothetical protein
MNFGEKKPYSLSAPDDSFLGAYLKFSCLAIQYNIRIAHFHGISDLYQDFQAYYWPIVVPALSKIVIILQILNFVLKVFLSKNCSKL